MSFYYIVFWGLNVKGVQSKMASLQTFELHCGEIQTQKANLQRNDNISEPNDILDITVKKHNFLRHYHILILDRARDD